MKFKFSFFKTAFLTALIFCFVFGLKAVQIEFPDSLLQDFSYLYKNSNLIEFEDPNSSGFAVIFLSGGKELDEDYKLETASGDVIYCKNQIQGVYLNPSLGNFLLPLDQTSLEKLRELGEYDNLKLDGGLFYNCSDFGENFVFGQVDWEISTGREHKIIAGIGQDNADFVEKLSYYEGTVWGEIYDSRNGFGNISGEIVDTVPDDFFIPMIKDAKPDTYYKSDPVKIEGLGYGVKVLAKISTGVDAVLFINGTGVGDSGYVENGDELMIEVKSSDDYDDITSVTLRVGSKSAIFYIQTRKSDEVEITDTHELTNTEKLWLMTLFKEVVDNYAGGREKLVIFLYTFKNVLDDKIGELDDEHAISVLSYFKTLVESYLMGGSESSVSNTSSSSINIISDLVNSDSAKYIETYTAPNCKKYVLMYDGSRDSYYSPDFRVQYYFISLDAIKKYIDKYNPGDGFCDGVEDYGDVNYLGGREDLWIAPNGKQYRIVKTANFKYTSPDFVVPKYFDTLEAIRRYIDYNNPAFNTRDHIYDASFTPVVHIAPNCRSYKIIRVFKNEKRYYTSYDFLYPKYFPTWDAIIAHIDNNNPGNCPISADEQDLPIDYTGDSHNITTTNPAELSVTGADVSGNVEGENEDTGDDIFADIAGLLGD